MFKKNYNKKPKKGMENDKKWKYLLYFQKKEFSEFISKEIL